MAAVTAEPLELTQELARTTVAVKAARASWFLARCVVSHRQPLAHMIVR